MISESHLTRENGEKRPNVIGIQYMLCKNKISTSHGVKFAIEIWIYLENTPLNLWCLDDGNKEWRRRRIDSNNPITIIPAGYWQAAKTFGEYTLASCCVGPGFDFLDFEMLRN